MRLFFITLGFALEVSAFANPPGSAGNFALSVFPSPGEVIHYEGRGAIVIDLPVLMRETYPEVIRNRMKVILQGAKGAQETVVWERGIPIDLSSPSVRRIRVAAFTLGTLDLEPGQYRIEVEVEATWRNYSGWRESDPIPPRQPLARLSGSTTLEIKD